jgi:hypothetical protein
MSSLLVLSGCRDKEIEFDTRISYELPKDLVAGELGNLDWVLFAGDGLANKIVIFDQKADGDIFQTIDAELGNKKILSTSVGPTYSWTDGQKYPTLGDIGGGFTVGHGKDGELKSKVMITLKINPDVNKIFIHGKSGSFSTHIEAITSTDQKITVAKMPDKENILRWNYEITIVKPGTGELQIVFSTDHEEIDPKRSFAGSFSVAGVFVEGRK